MKIALIQMNSWLGQFASNRQKIVEGIHWAHQQGARIAVFPECALMGYHPVDLLERSSVVDAELLEIREIKKNLPKGMGVLFGCITKNKKKSGKRFQNSAVYLERGKLEKVFSKQLLPTYDVFDEARHIEPGETRNNFIRVGNTKILVTICEDIWAWPVPGRETIYDQNPLLQLPKKNVDLVLNLSASPFTNKKWLDRKRVIKNTARHFSSPVLYCNMVGAQDELIFDGRSLCSDAKGNIVHVMRSFAEDRVVFDISQKHKSKPIPPPSAVADRYSATVLGIRDFVFKTGFERVHLGLSGGIDSAVVAALAVEALGPKRVTCIALPGPFSDPNSLKWAEQQAKAMETNFASLSIVDTYNTLLNQAAAVLGNSTEISLMEENLQARLRGLSLMAFSNRHGSLLLNTSNKSEFAVGYTTLYGDLCGALSPIGDLLKSQVYELAHFINSIKKVIPDSVISRAPSAELRPQQKDSDTLPDYAVLDPIVEKLVENFSVAKSEVEKKVLRMLMQSEFKRWQAPPVLKLSDHSFGRGRRFPVAHKAVY